METLRIIESLNDAIVILGRARRCLAGGSLTLWRLVDHAGEHLDSQIAELLTTETAKPAR